MTEKHEKALAAIKELFGESTDPEVIKKYADVENSIKEADDEYIALEDKHISLAKDYRDVILNTPTKTPPKDIVPEKPKSFGEALADAIKAAKPQA